jgi:hypothetical protein
MTSPTDSQRGKEDSNTSRGGTELKLKVQEVVGEEASATPIESEPESSQRDKVKIPDRQTASLWLASTPSLPRKRNGSGNATLACLW